MQSAHRSAKEALVELRDLARGIHPPVLDAGLADALATLAARSLIPVELTADIDPDPRHQRLPIHAQVQLPAVSPSPSAT